MTRSQLLPALRHLAQADISMMQDVRKKLTAAVSLDPIQKSLGKNSGCGSWPLHDVVPTARAAAREGTQQPADLCPEHD